jgi:hypothetical protein
MLCYFCQGRRLVAAGRRVQPCEECGGRGEIHCCEGLQAQGEAPAPPRLCAGRTSGLAAPEVHTTGAEHLVRPGEQS